MLHWPPGPRARAGVWAPHWYRSADASTGFTAPALDPPPMDDALEALAAAARPAYRHLRQHKI
jgi:hypothetical protein